MGTTRDGEDLAAYHARQRANDAENRLRDDRRATAQPADDHSARGTVSRGSWIARVVVAALLVGLGWLVRGFVP